ncbi:MAG: pitrilysin family protein [Tenuifilum sp.]|uniref:M16 family metallopeptidase n=2 Tax=Tenuifilum sp. TaxID=2760880 RepID=UPI002C1330C3|nr:pitrilysin family protein [Tenuifilum sp.]
MTSHNIDRTVQPQRVAVSSIKIPTPDIIVLNNGFKVLVINAGSQDLARVEVIFRAGTRFQPKPLVANAAISLLRDGTISRTSQQIAEELDFYGSFLEPSFSRDFASVTFYTIGKHFYRSLDVLADILTNPTYPQHELELFCKKGKQSLLVDLEKVSTLSRQRFFSALFGSNHPYGSFATPNDYDVLSQTVLVQFRNRYHKASNGLIVIAGKVDAKQVDFLVNGFNNPIFEQCDDIELGLPSFTTTDYRVFSYKKDAVQAALRIGRVLPKRNHPDMPGLVVLNTILGGYFGSRLMRNIREDKGFTYGISSFIIPMAELSALVVSTEVGSAFTEKTVDEVFKEMIKLQTEPVSNDELELVRGYMTGQVLRTFDGPFAIADSLASLFQYNNLDFEYINNLIRTINEITPTQLLGLAKKYLDVDRMVVSIAGSKRIRGYKE